jgi:hypothetical protein
MNKFKHKLILTVFPGSSPLHSPVVSFMAIFTV